MANETGVPAGRRQAGVRGAVGAQGEDAAVALLIEQGLQIVDRNWRCREGELDVVAWDPRGRVLVVCEVKCRTGLGYGDPLEAITAAKLRRLRRLAGLWLAEHPTDRVAAVRLDAVGVLWPRGRRPTLRHLQGLEG